jgi:hypothetical protein
MNNNYDKELEWKKHDVFFNNLNKQLETIAEISANCLLQVEKINLYRSWVDTMINMYYVYIINDDELKNNEQKLQKIQEFLHSHDYIKSINNISTLSPEKKGSLYNKQAKAVRDLNKVVRWLVQNLAEHQLIPKPLKKKKYDPNKAILNNDF